MWEVLDRIRSNGALADLETCRGSDLRGFVAALSHELVLVSLVTEDYFDGGVILGVGDIEYVRWGTDILESRNRLVKASPSAPESIQHIDLGSWSAAIRSVAASDAVLSFRRADTLTIGANIEVRDELVQGDYVTPAGGLDGHFAFTIDEVARLEFSSTYERMLGRLLSEIRGCATG